MKLLQFQHVLKEYATFLFSRNQHHRVMPVYDMIPGFSFYNFQRVVMEHRFFCIEIFPTKLMRILLC